MKKAISLVLFGSFASFSQAEVGIPEQLEQCHKVKADAERLKCFDQIGKTKAEEKAEKTDSAEPESAGQWLVTSDKSPIDDSENVHVFLLAENQISSRFDRAITPSLSIICREKKTELFIDWGTYLGLDSTQVLTRIDSQQAINRSWQISTDSKATFYSGQSIAYIKYLMKSKKMFVKITPYGENPVQATFALEGLSNAIQPLRKSCKW
ncbi:MULTISPECIES: type VI secretion system-associated protein TagO [Serratia]|uniref:Type VI secretion protein n=1 Tax=Serratia fonticola TaxID=47917 RepID=A0AAE7EM65_SERFO|nr:MULTISPECIES: type VI secretion system-associated protein TagO [Serratia]QKJ61471.2 type VI secretion protein [Serratia fonticola]